MKWVRPVQPSYYTDTQRDSWSCGVRTAEAELNNSPKVTYVIFRTVGDDELSVKTYRGWVSVSRLQRLIPGMTEYEIFHMRGENIIATKKSTE